MGIMPNERCNRLYDLSLEKQLKGKLRREEISRSKMKPPPLHQGKISAEKAAKMYDRGMLNKMNLEKKRIEAAIKPGIPYKSPLVDVDTDEGSRDRRDDSPFSRGSRGSTFSRGSAFSRGS